MQYGAKPKELTYSKWDIGFYGMQVDDRGEQAISFIKENSSDHYDFEYISTNFTIQTNEEVIIIDDIDEYFKKFKPQQKVIMDCSTLGVVEMLIIIQSMFNNGIRTFDALYIEPISYKNSKGKIVQKRNFELSSEFDGYIGIPGHTLYLSTKGNDKFAFFCGYESERIERAFEDLNINCKKCQLFFGLPAFHTGWELNTYSNNIRVIENRNIENTFYYCGASNPMSVCEKLQLIYNGLGEDENLFLVPVGTKPMALGACIFKVSTNDNNRIAFLYDHPKKTKNRSSEVARWNLYNIKI